MSHGLPDYYRGVDIAYQALSELINRPKYGAAQQEYSSVTVTNNFTTTLLSMAGKGVIYGGVLYMDYTASQSNAVVALYVDDVQITAFSLANLTLFGMTKEHAYPVYILAYDEVNYRYCVGFSGQITFETSIVLKYLENNGGTPLVLTRLIYALI